MIELYKPDMYKDNIYNIDYTKLKNMGILCLIFDLDNTLAPLDIIKPSKKLKDFIEKLKDMNFKIIIMSNSTKKRVRPFKEILDVDSSAISFKPFKYKYNKILSLYNYSVSEIAVIGDQLSIDIYGGNKMGFYSVYVNHINNNEYIWTRINRIREKKILRKLNNKKLFIEGKYYD